MFIRGSILTGVASPIAERTGGVMSTLLDLSRLRVADLGVMGGGRPWLETAAAAEERKVEK